LRLAPGTLDTMPLELERAERDQAIASIERWFQTERDERIGNIAAGALLGYFLEEIAPLIYNRAIADAQERLQQQVSELDIGLHEEPMRYWSRRPDSPPPAPARRRKG
jgi:uncharacterized protein (DUF2164 family)